MPTRLCSHERCPSVATYRGRCSVHARGRERETHHNKHVYNTARWRYLRRSVLINDPICVACNEALATDADHKVPIERGGPPFDPENVQALCSRCHGIKTKMEMQER